MAAWPYNTRRWQRLRALKLASDPLCEYHVDGIAAATQVDHRKAIKDGGDPWAWDNLASTCGPCHTRKTSHVEVHRHGSVPVRGVDLDGYPLAGSGHWWASS